MAEKYDALKQDDKTIIADYRGVFDRASRYTGVIEGVKETAKEVLGSDFEELQDRLHEMNSMDHRAEIYALTVLAKMKLRDKRYEPYTLDDLLDFRHDSKETAAEIRSYLMDITREPEAVRRTGESEADFEARKESEEEKAALKAERLRRFNVEFFKPMSDQLVNILQLKFEEMSELGVEEKLQALVPYHGLFDGMFDSYSQKFSYGADNKPNAHVGYKQAEFVKETSRLDAMNTMSNYDSGRMDSLRELRDRVLTGEDYDSSLMMVLIKNSSVDYLYREAPERLKRIETFSPDKTLATYNEMNESLAFINSNFAMNDLESHGLTSQLTKAERLVLAIDPKLQQSISISKDEDDQPRFMLGDLDLQCNCVPGSEDGAARLDTSKLGVLRQVIADAHVRQRLSDGVAFSDTAPRSLEKGLTAMKDAEKLLSDRTHWYNSSSEYRAMQDSLTALRKYTERIAKKDGEPTLEEQKRMLELTEKAKNAAGAYLAGKDETGNRMAFKNDYETRRVSGARAVFGMLESSEASLRQRAKEAEFRDMADKVKSLMIENVPGLELSEEEWKEYGSPERMAVHEKAAASEAEIEETRKWAVEKAKLLGIETSKVFNRAIAGYLSPMRDPDAKRENVAMLRVLSGNRPVDMYAKETLFFDAMARTNKLDADALDLRKHSMEEVVDYSIAHRRELILAFDVQNIRGTANYMNMPLKPEASQNFEALVSKFERTGGMGRTVLSTMSNRIGCMLPLERMTVPQIAQTADLLLENSEELELTNEEKRFIGHIMAFKTQRDRLEEYADRPTRVNDLKPADYDNVMTRDRLRREMEPEFLELRRERERERALENEARAAEREGRAAGGRQPREREARVMEDLLLG